MNHEELYELLIEKGFTTGWALAGDALILWQHDQDPPAPLVRPTDETPGAS
jgi:hypothetical protein